MCPKTCGKCKAAEFAAAAQRAQERNGGGADSDTASIFVAISSICGLVAAVYGASAYYRRSQGDALQGAYVALAGGEGQGPVEDA